MADKDDKKARTPKGRESEMAAYNGGEVPEGSSAPPLADVLSNVMPDDSAMQRMLRGKSTETIIARDANGQPIRDANGQIQLRYAEPADPKPKPEKNEAAEALSTKDKPSETKKSADKPLADAFEPVSDEQPDESDAAAALADKKVPTRVAYHAPGAYHPKPWQPPSEDANSKYGTAFDTATEKAKTYLASAGAKNAGSTNEDPAAELARLRQENSDAKDTLDKRELGHELAEALTKLAGGYAGLKTGTDMSHIDFKQHDFQKDRQLLEEGRKTDLSDLATRRQEADRNSQFNEQQGLAKANLGLGVATAISNREQGLAQIHNQEEGNALHAKQLELEGARQETEAQWHNAMLDVYGMRDATRAQNAFQKDIAAKNKGAVEYQKSSNAVLDDIRKISEDKKIDSEDDRRKAYAASISTRLGLPYEDALKITSVPGFVYGQNAASTGEIRDKIGKITSQEYKIRKLQADPARNPNKVLVAHHVTGPDGQVTTQYGWANKGVQLPPGMQLITERTTGMPGNEPEEKMPGE